MFEGSSAVDCGHGGGSASKTTGCFDHYRTVDYDVWARGADDQSTDDESTLFDQLVLCGRKFNLRRLARKQVQNKKTRARFSEKNGISVFRETP